jgi:hypothetical protein
MPWLPGAPIFVCAHRMRCVSPDADAALVVPRYERLRLCVWTYYPVCGGGGGRAGGGHGRRHFRHSCGARPLRTARPRPVVTKGVDVASRPPHIMVPCHCPLKSILFFPSSPTMSFPPVQQHNTPSPADAVLGEARAWEFALGASGRHLVEVPNTASLADALRIMNDKHVSSLPVFVQEPGPGDGVRCTHTHPHPPYVSGAGRCAWVHCALCVGALCVVRGCLLRL